MTFLLGIFAHPLQRFTQTILAGMDILQADGLGTDVTFAQDIILITAYGDNLFAIVFDLYATHGFTEVTGTVVQLIHGGACRGRRR